MSAAGGGDPFAVLGLPARAGLTDDDVRAAWRRLATATHPDRADGGDPDRFAAAAAAYTVLRTRSGRGEALADLAPAGPPSRTERRAARGAPAPAGRPSRTERRATRGAGPGRLMTARLVQRVRRGRPARLALRVLLAVAIGIGVAAVAGLQPAAPALWTGLATWLLLTARHDLAPPT